MNKKLQIITGILLIAAMLFVGYIALPAKVFAEETDRAAFVETVKSYANANSFSQDNTLAYSPLKGELTGNRDESIKVFRRADGAQEAVVYRDPVHFLKGEKWETIDNTLELVKDKGGTEVYRNKANDFSVSFSPVFSADDLITVENNGHVLSWRFAKEVTTADNDPLYQVGPATVGAETADAALTPTNNLISITDAQAAVIERDRKDPETDEERDMRMRFPAELTSEIAYLDPETGLNVHYVLSNKRLSEQIILDRAPDAAVSCTTLLTTNGLKPEKQNEQIFFVDSDGEPVFELMAPVMFDANGEESQDIKVQLFEADDGYAYTLIPNYEWLTDKTRVYPVTIDPDVKITKNAAQAGITDTYVDSDNPNTNYGSGSIIWVSDSSGTRQIYSLVKPNTLPTLKSGDIILEAGIHYARYSSSTSATIVVSGYRLNGSWSDTTATYSNIPSYDSDPVTFAATSEANRHSEFDITSTVKSWYEDPSSNYGILLKGNGYAKFISADATTTIPPYLSLIYRNSTGLESNWTYYSQSAGRAGTGSVNLASGNLTWTTLDNEITNGILPISLSHVYNTNDRGSDIGYGFGWRLNYAQTLLRFPVANGNETTLYYEYTDGDGTRHYYKEGHNEFVNELDQDSKLTFNTGETEATITDKGDNKLIFQVFTSGSGDTLDQKGRLIRIEDANGNQTQITYRIDNDWTLQISKITEQLSGENAGQELTLSYNEDDELESISAPNGLTVSLAYSADDLVSVGYADSNTVYFDYADHCLTKATNIDGYNLRYTYNEKNEVTGVQEYAGSTQGQGLNFAYGRSKVVVTDSQNRKTIYTVDSLGQPISVTDPEDRALFAAYNTADQTVTQLSAVSKLQHTVINLLVNHGFEKSSSSLTGWTASNSSKITVDSSMRKEGRRSAKFINASAELTLSQTLSIEVGKTYTLSAWFKGLGSGQVKAITGASTFAGDPVSANEDEWTRATVTFAATATTATVMLVVPANNGIIHGDSVQLEESETPSRYNMLENGDFRNGITCWEGRNYSAYNGVGSLTDPAYQEYTGNHPVKLGNSIYCFNHIAHSGEIRSEYVSQTITASGEIGDTYSFGGWLMSTCPPKSTQYIDSGYHPIGVKSISVEFLSSSGSVTASSTVEFSADTTEWQYACGVAVATHSYSSIRLKINATRCIGVTLTDGLQLYREEFSQAYTYDSKGNLTGYKSLIGQQNSFKYDSYDNIKSSTDPRGNTTTYTYDTHHNLLTATSPEGVVTTNTYNNKGLTTETTVGNNTDYIRTAMAYNAYGMATSETDPRGNTVQNAYNDSTRQIIAVTDARGTVTNYNTGNASVMRRLESLSQTGLNPVAFGYQTNGQVNQISRGNQNYNYEYDVWGRIISVAVGENVVSVNTYDEAGRLSTVQYGNGFTVKYTYDKLDRVQKTQFKTNASSQYEDATENIFNGEGNLYEERNYLTNKATFFEYDHAGRCMATKARPFTPSGNTISYGPVESSYFYQYDVNNNVTRVRQSVDGSTWEMFYTYDKDNRGLTTTLSNNIILSNTYDAVSRISQRTIGLQTAYNVTVDYLPGASGSSTPLVAEYKNGTDSAFVYAYDANGNVISVTQGTKSYTYEYDTSNQLIRANVYNNSTDNYTVTYTYDGNGNIRLKTYYPYTTGALGTESSSVSCEYSTGDWKDQITKYNGQSIEYDGAGNPYSYLGDSLGWSGLQLTSINNDISYNYNDDGLRQSKTVGGTTTVYYYNGTVLMGTDDGSHTLLFSYDEQSSVVAVNYDGTYYYYLRDGQGSIVKLIDGNGATVVEYSYDPWGVCTTTGSMAESLGADNPFRFHGYVYDEETGWYYLQSRYYDPVVGRYISADTTASTGQGILGYNMYAYCLNNPTTNYDPTGSFSFSNILSGSKLISIGIVAVCTAVSVLTCGAAAPVMVAVAAVTLTAGAVTVANGVAEVQQGITATDENPQGQNFMRDGYCGGNTEAYEFQKNVMKTTAEVGTTILTCYQAINGPCCFVAGTLILTENGQMPIELIQKGDGVYATDPETGESGYRQVVQTFERETDEIVWLQINGETIVTTPGHPFYVPQKGWTKAIELRAGDILVTSNGEYVILEKTEHEILESPVKVFNFEVEEFHTYYVGDAEGVLVHNSCSSVQKHHMLTNKNSNYTPRFQEVTDKYGLSLNGKWNIQNVGNHMGRHTSAYHEFMLKQITSIDVVARGDIDRFLFFFDKLSTYVVNHPEVLYK